MRADLSATDVIPDMPVLEYWFNDLSLNHLGIEVLASAVVGIQRDNNQGEDS